MLTPNEAAQATQQTRKPTEKHKTDLIQDVCHPHQVRLKVSWGYGGRTSDQPTPLGLFSYEGPLIPGKTMR